MLNLPHYNWMDYITFLFVFGWTVVDAFFRFLFFSFFFVCVYSRFSFAHRRRSKSRVKNGFYEKFKRNETKQKKNYVYQSSYGKRVAYIPYWSDTYGPGLGVFVFTFEPDVVVELVWCGGPCNTSSYNRVLLTKTPTKTKFTKQMPIIPSCRYNIVMIITIITSYHTLYIFRNLFVRSALNFGTKPQFVIIM